MTTKLARRKRTDKQKIADRLDALFSEYIRKRAWQRSGSCERAQYVTDHEPIRSWQDLQCAHFHSRNKHTVRWDERNSVGLCGGCHMYLDSHIDAKKEFAQQLLGDEEYERLYILAEMTTKQSPIDYKLIELSLKELLKQETAGG